MGYELRYKLIANAIKIGLYKKKVLFMKHIIRYRIKIILKNDI